VPTSRIIQGVGNEASQRFRVTLEEKVFVIELTWTDTGRCWYASLYTSDEAPIVLNQRISTNVPIFTHILTGMAGGLAAVSLVSPAVALTRSPWGVTHNLVYSE